MIFASARRYRPRPIVWITPWSRSAVKATVRDPAATCFAGGEWWEKGLHTCLGTCASGRMRHGGKCTQAVEACSRIPPMIAGCRAWSRRTSRRRRLATRSLLRRRCSTSKSRRYGTSRGTPRSGASAPCCRGCNHLRSYRRTWTRLSAFPACSTGVWGSTCRSGGRRLRLARRYPPRRSAPGADRQQVRAAVEAGYQHIEHAQRLALATEYHARWVT